MNVVTRRLETIRYGLANGHYLHGSKNLHRVLLPFQAHSLDGDPVCCQRAVYAADDERCAVVMALLHSRTDPAKPGFSEYHMVGNSFRVSGHNMVFRTGWVHFVPHRSFQIIESERSREIISRTPVVPTTAVQVMPEIIRLLDITLDFDYDPFA